MKLSSRLIERYIAAAILPYTLLALLLLTAILVAQQGSRFAELLGQVEAPLPFVLEIIANLIPGLLVFTLPMAVLAGTLIGFSRMGSDSELTAMRAAGVGVLNMLAAPFVLGTMATCATLGVGIFYTPYAAARLRDVALRAAESRLKSPIQPGTFATNVGDKVIYVRDGDEARGEWRGVFVFSQQGDGQALLVTAERGRLDSSSEVAELVLHNAVATTLNFGSRDEANGVRQLQPTAPVKQLIREQSAYLRIKLEDNLSLLVARLRTRQPELDELTWRQLRAAARTAPDAKRRREALVVQHKKVALGFAPLCFALLAAAVGLRIQRGGRGIGVLLSLALMMLYYLLVLAGEQLARTDALPVAAGLWLATALTLVAAFLLLLAPRLRPGTLFKTRFDKRASHLRAAPQSPARATLSPHQDPDTRRITSSAPSPVSLFGLLDRTLLTSLSFNFIFTLCALTAVFLIFTLFELWRHIAANNIGWQVVLAYHLFLVPFVCVSLSSVAVLVSVLFTYAILARRSEAVAWLACGQSLYRLFLPSLLLACGVGLTAWMLQSEFLPRANQRQDALRAEIRGGRSQTIAFGGRRWIAAPDKNRVFSFEETVNGGNRILSPLVFEYSHADSNIARVLKAAEGNWQTGGLRLSDVEVARLASASPQTTEKLREIIVPLPFDDTDAIDPATLKLSHLDTRTLKSFVAQSARRTDATHTTLRARLNLEKRFVVGVTPLIMALLAMPLAMSYGRRSTLVSLCAAILVGMLFWGATGAFELLGAYGLLPIGVAAWGSPVVFAVLGFYLLTRTRT